VWACENVSHPQEGQHWADGKDYSWGRLRAEVAHCCGRVGARKEPSMPSAMMPAPYLPSSRTSSSRLLTHRECTGVRNWASWMSLRAQCLGTRHTSPLPQHFPPRFPFLVCDSQVTDNAEILSPWATLNPVYSNSPSLVVIMSPFWTDVSPAPVPRTRQERGEK
jgi:hypothetical protein